jgi:hypothetical protein
MQNLNSNGAGLAINAFMYWGTLMVIKLLWEDFAINANARTSIHAYCTQQIGVTVPGLYCTHISELLHGNRRISIDASHHVGSSQLPLLTGVPNPISISAYKVVPAAEPQTIIDDYRGNCQL